MTSVWNNSNANSAIVNTILASPSVYNPNVYSTKQITPPHSVTWTPCAPSGSNEIRASGTTNFTLSKFGIIEQILFSVTKNSGVGPVLAVPTAAGSSGVGFRAGDIFRMIDRIELLSSSRVISTLTSQTLVAQISNLEMSSANPVLASGVSAAGTSAITQPAGIVAPFNQFGAGGTGPGATPAPEYTIPLVFPLMNEIGTQLNSTFLEPLTIQVHWSNTLNEFGVMGAAAFATIPAVRSLPFPENPMLQVRYKNYPEEATSQILAGNFEKPELNLLSETWYQENTVEVTQQAGAGVSPELTAVIDLKNTDAVTEFYVMVQPVNELQAACDETGDDLAVPAGAPNPAALARALNPSAPPVEIRRLQMTGSGQTLFDLSARQLAYSKLTNTGWSVAAMSVADPTGNTAAPIGSSDYPFAQVQEFQTGRYAFSAGTEPCMTNCLSLREVNAPQITVTFQPNDLTIATNTYRVTVVEKALAIYAISSATGRMTLALSN